MNHLNPDSEIQKSGGELPHWQQGTVLQFVTFRLGDSLPISLMREWQEERLRWLAAHPQPWSAAVGAEYHRNFSAKIEHWLDQGMGSCLFADSAARQVLAECLMRFDGERVCHEAWVIMPNHVHVLFSPKVPISTSNTPPTPSILFSSQINTAYSTSSPHHHSPILFPSTFEVPSPPPTFPIDSQRLPRRNSSRKKLHPPKACRHAGGYPHCSAIDMGNFYTQVLVADADTVACADLMKRLNRRTVVGPSHRKLVPIFDAESEHQNLEVLDSVALTASSELNTWAVGLMNHDDSHLLIRIFHRGEERAGIAASFFGCLDFAASKNLCAALNPDASPLLVQLSLFRPSLFQVGRHASLARILGLPRWTVGAGYNYIQRGEFDGTPEAAAFIRT